MRVWTMGSHDLHLGYLEFILHPCYPAGPSVTWDTFCPNRHHAIRISAGLMYFFHPVLFIMTSQPFSFQKQTDSCMKDPILGAGSPG